MNTEGQSGVSIARLMANVAGLLEEQPLTNELHRAALNIWLGKIFVFFNSLNKQEEDVQEKTLLHIKLRSSRSIGYFWNHSFSTIVADATTEAEKKTFTFSRAFKQAAREGLEHFRTAIALFNVFIASRSNKVVLFDNEIDPIKVAQFFEEKAQVSTKTAPVFLATVPSVVDAPVSRFSELTVIGSKRAKEIHSICAKALDLSTSNSPTKPYDALVPLSSVELALTHLENLLPVELLNDPSYLRRVLKTIVSSYSKYPITILDRGALLLRNRCLFFVSQTHTCEFYGVQHGGQYGEIRSAQTALEITSPTYDQGFLGWGFGLDYADFQRAPLPSNRISVLGPPAILYPQSMPSSSLDNRSSNERNLSLRDSSKDLLLTALRRLDEPYWVKSHPKSPRPSFSNVKKENLIVGSHKPGVDRASIKLVVFDAPGQTLFFECLRNKIPCLFCFALSAYDLTRPAVLYFAKLESVGMFVNLDTNVVDAPLKVVSSIKALLEQEGAVTLSPANHF